MAKTATPVIERFRISSEIEAANLGPVIAQLTKMGLTNIHFELITDVVTFRQKTNHEIKSVEFLAGWVKDNPTFKAIEACKYFEANGRTRGSAYPALAELVEAGVLKKLDDPGHYARADVKHIAPPKKHAKTKTKVIAKKANGQKYAVPNGDFILRVARRKHGRFHTADIKKAFKKDGRPPSSASPAINDLLTKKLISRIGEGLYELPKLNGGPSNVEATSVEATNG